MDIVGIINKKDFLNEIKRKVILINKGGIKKNEKEFKD